MNTTRISVDEFFQTKYPIEVFSDSSESGDYRLYCPEDKYIAEQYKNDGFKIASIYENESGEYILLDNDTSESHHKIGFFVYE
jgi:hypothetical protein